VGEFRDLLETAAKKYPTKKEFAKAIGITPGRLSRVLGGEHSLDVGNCLTLAKLTGESPSRVLRVAGKGEIADAIETLYGPAAPSISPRDREVLRVWNNLSPRAQENLRVIMVDLYAGSGTYAKGVKAARTPQIDVDIAEPAHPVVVREKRSGSAKRGR
jgi:transcriptional regulator with XRE-family HTH domain